MTDVTKEAVAVANGTAKKNRRGISNNTVAAARLKFHEKDASPANGLFMAHLDSVSVEWSQNAEGNSFAGLKMPRLVVTFASNHDNVKERRYVTKTFFPVESNVDTIPGGKNAWQVDAVLNWTKHLLDVFYLKGRELTVEEEDALTLTFEDYTEDENGNLEYNAVDAQDVLNGYRHIFDNVAAMLNGQFNLAGLSRGCCHRHYLFLTTTLLCLAPFPRPDDRHSVGIHAGVAEQSMALEGNLRDLYRQSWCGPSAHRAEHPAGSSAAGSGRLDADRILPGLWIGETIL